MESKSTDNTPGPGTPTATAALGTPPVKETPSATASGTPPVEETPSATPAKAYEHLESKLSNQCLRYFAFHEKEVFGSFPHMYKEDESGKQIPTEIVSDYFGGGIISTMAIFEAFIVDLLKEAYNIKECKKQGCSEECKKDHPERKSEISTIFKQSEGPSVTFHCWESAYDRALLPEECDTQEDTQEKAQKSKQKKTKKLTHKNSPKFTDYLFRSTPEHKGLDETFKQITYTYVLKNGVYSKVKIGTNRKESKDMLELKQHRQERSRKRLDPNEFEDESTICAFLRLFYGIRCAMAHGNSETTLYEKILKKFPSCPTCDQHPGMTNIILKDSMDLVHYLYKYMDQLDKEPSDKKKIVKELITEDQPNKGQDMPYDASGAANRKIGKIPKKEDFEKLKGVYAKGLEEPKGSEEPQSEEPKGLEEPKGSEEPKGLEKPQSEEWNDVFKIIETHFADPDQQPLPVAFAFFHMCRIFFYLKKKKKNMYITYRVLVRINQFIRMLAFRMHIAVAEILIRKHELPNKTWGIRIEEKKEDGTISDFGNIDKKIKKFEEEHEVIVKKTETSESSAKYGEFSKKFCKEKFCTDKDKDEYRTRYGF